MVRKGEEAMVVGKLINKAKKISIAPIDLNIPIALIALAITMWGIIMPMISGQDAKMERFMTKQDEKMEKTIDAIRYEMRDFHDRLIKIEMEKK